MNIFMYINPRDVQVVVYCCSFSLRYYEVNLEVMRELAGKKLKNKLRSTLYDICEKTGIGSTSCKRQVCSDLHSCFV